MAGPKTYDVLRALRAHLDVRAHSMRRFKTGLAHYVYEIMTDGEPVVVRMADPDHWNGIPGGVYWHARLKSIGVPVPELLGYDLETPYPYMVLERLPGSDLGKVYPSLSVAEKLALAEEIAGIQEKVGALPPAGAYGWLDSYENPSRPFPDWASVLESGLVEAQEHIARIGIFDPALVDQVRQAARPFAARLADVAPAPFLDDTTTKNILIENGRLTGIVDTDNVCFGDRLYVLALTNMALLADGQPTDYIRFWAEAWGCSRADLRLVDLYTLMHGVYFMSEIGRTFNHQRPETVRRETIARYQDIVLNLLGKFR